jgi:hypothetical protein
MRNDFCAVSCAERHCARLMARFPLCAERSVRWKTGLTTQHPRRNGRYTMKKFALLATLGVATLLVGSKTSARDIAPFFETVIFPGDTFTQLLGVNDSGVIAGYHGMNINKGFVLTLPYNFTPENYPSSVQTQVTGINDWGNTSGFYIDSGGINHGFLDIKGSFTNVDFPGTTFNQLLGVNRLQQAAGYYADVSNIDHPYIYDFNGGVFSVLTIPLATGGAQATGINDQGAISGFYIDASSVTHGYVIINGQFTTLDYPSSTSTMALGLNNWDQVVGVYVDTSNLMHGFLYERGEFNSIDDPSGIGTTTVNGINNRGEIVGFYVDSDGNTDGFAARVY